MSVPAFMWRNSIFVTFGSAEARPMVLPTRANDGGWLAHRSPARSPGCFGIDLPDMPRHLHHSKRSGGLGPRELVAIGVGGMIGGGIFSILGLGAQIAGRGVVAALAIGGVVALFAGYSYVHLAGAYPTDGASYTYLSRAFPEHPAVASITGWTVILGYVGTLGLYAFTFGAYAADLFGRSESTVLRLGLAVLILGLFLVINLAGTRMTGATEDLVVYTKIGILAVFGIVGLVATRSDFLIPSLERGIGSVFMAGALIFVAFEGFQLITNAVEETDDPERNIPRGVYISIGVVIVIYLVLAYVATLALSVDQLVAAREYALAAVADPILGEAGTVLVALAALLATSSAINSTLFGASRMMADMGSDGTMPSAFTRRNTNQSPHVALFAMTGLAVGLSLSGSLDIIASFSSLTFLLVSAAVSVANLRVHRETKSRVWIVVTGLILMIATIGLLIFYLASNSPVELAALAAIYLLAIVANRSFETWRRRQPSTRSVK